MSKTDLKVFLSNVARRWKKAVEAEDASQILVFSPYMTSSTVDSVFEKVDPESCSIYTLFSAENFAHGSSSLKTVRKLHEKGFRIYHLPLLHAKAVIASKDFASIGSQNITLQGTKNREATIIVTDNTQTALIRSMFEEWTKDGQIVSSEMIHEMEQAILPLQKIFKKLKNDAGGIEQEVFDNERERIEERKQRALQAAIERRRREEERIKRANTERTARKLHLDATIAKMPKASTVIYGSVKQSKFIPVGNRRFTIWFLGGELITLKRAYRYVCMLPDSGRFAWVRVMDGRLSYIQRGLKRVEMFEVNGISYELRFHATWQSDPYIDGNITVTFSRAEGRISMMATMWFGIDSLIFLHHSVDYMPGDEEIALLMELRNDSSSLHGHLFKAIFDPFKYEKKLTGSAADEFFGYRAYQITLHQLKSREVILVGRLT